MQQTVRDAMTTNVLAVPCHARIAEAEHMLLAHGVEELFVHDDENLLCGVVPDYELLKWRLSPSSEQTSIDAIMSRRFLVIGPDSSLSVAARYLREHFHRRLAVVEQRRLIGQVTRRNILGWLASMADSLNPSSSRDGEPEEDLHRLDEVTASRSPQRSTLARS